MDRRENKGSGRIKSMDYCFACGRKNPYGLKLSFTFDGKMAKSKVTPLPHHQGWQNILHGGLITTLLDEAMVYAAYFSGKDALTGEIKVRFRKEIPVGEEIEIEGWIEKSKLNLIFTKARLLNSKGEILAEGEGKLVPFKESS